MTLTEAMSIAATAISLGSLGIAWLKVRPANKNTSADTADKYQKIADDAAEKIIALQKDVDRHEKATGELKARLYACEEKANRFENWAKRLAAQVISLGAVPVDLDPTRPVKKDE